MFLNYSFIDLLYTTLFFYTYNLLLLLLLSYKFNLHKIENFSIFYNNFKNKLMVNFFFFNLMGVPLTPGFFFKLQLLVFLFKKTNSILLSVIIVTINFIFFYFYVSNIKKISKKSYTKNISLGNSTLIFIYIYLIINFFFCFFWPFFFIF